MSSETSRKCYFDGCVATWCRDDNGAPLPPIADVIAARKGA